MPRKVSLMYKILILLIGIALLNIGSANAATTSVEPLSGFYPIADFNKSIVAGNEYSALFEFTANYDTTVVINFTIEHPEINDNEWCGVILFNETAFPDEIDPGVFSTGEVEIKKGYHLVGVQYKPDIAIVPGNYNFSLDILSENILIESSRRSSGGHGTLPLVIPTPNATAEAGDGGIPNATATSTPPLFHEWQEPLEDLGNLYPMNLYFLIVIVLLMVRGWLIERFY